MFTTTPNPQHLPQVAAVEAINGGSAVAFQAGELLLLGVVQAANSAATTLGNTGDVGAAVAAGAATATGVVTTAGGVVTKAVDTAAKNIAGSLHEPLTPTKAATTTVPGVGGRHAAVVSTPASGGAQVRGSFRASDIAVSQSVQKASENIHRVLIGGTTEQSRKCCWYRRSH